ncbi:VanZ family protein [Caenimonas soli]|uniref:VanZ family protein n=1 Tax=Caenimonas soli TaxID=2735555 RepID=UPI0015575729|nr:VanZ family protein [Caenimonas soli]NPC58082.1 VanZ family protein [Caenimonas soli]
MPIERRRAYSRWAFSVCLVVVLVAALAPPHTIVPPTGWDKVQHAVAFAVLAMLGCGAYPERKAQVLLGLLAYGGLIELLQSFTGYRTAETLDVVADAVGLVVGWTFTRLLWRTRPVPPIPKDQP